MWQYKYTGQPEHLFNKMSAEIILKHCKLNHRNFYFRTLELGAGTGQLSYLLKKASNNDNQLSICVDESVSAVEYMNSYFNKSFKPFEHLIIHKNIFDCIDLITNENFKNYELVMSSGLIEHFKDNKLKELCEIHKKLSGVFVVIIVPADNPENNAEALTEKHIKKYGYEKPMNEKELDLLFIDNTFKKIHSERFYKNGKLLISIYRKD